MRYYGTISNPKDPITKEFLESYLASFYGGGGTAAGVYVGTFLTDGTSPHFDIVHNLDSKDIIAAFFDNATDEMVILETQTVDTDTVRVDGRMLPAGLTFRATVVAKSLVMSGGNSPSGSGTADHSQLTNRDAANQHPISAIQGLVIALAAKADVSQLPGVATATDDGLLAAADKRILDAATDELAALAARLNALGALATAPDAPANGKPHMRQDGSWIEAAASGGSGGGAIVGEIRLLPFRATALPTGWHFCNGDRYHLGTAQGDALNALPAQLKSDWGIIVSGGSISLPTLFDAAGSGCFPRPVNGSDRTPGHIQSDAIRNITGSILQSPEHGAVWTNSAWGNTTLTGAFRTLGSVKNKSFNQQTHGVNTIGDLYFDASGSVPVASENRPLNVGMTPAIYLGV